MDQPGTSDAQRSNDDDELVAAAALLMLSGEQASESGELASESDSGPKVRVQLKSSDEQILKVDEDVASQSVLVKDMIKAHGTSAHIAVDVSSEILSKVIDYCTYVVESRKPTSVASATARNKINAAKWDAHFVSKFDQDTLCTLLETADYLQIQSLVDLVCQVVAGMIKEKPMEEIRMIFNIQNNLTREEQAEIREEHKWAFNP